MSDLNEDLLRALLGEGGGGTGDGHARGVGGPVAGRPRSLTFHAGGRLLADEPVAGVLLPGSFNPLHDGHRGLADVAADVAGATATYELSVVNVDKPPLDLPEVERRLRPFETSRWPVALTRAPTFLEKARLFPGVTFAIGWDTAVRIVHARYYASDAAMREALAEMRDLGCRFLVAGRRVDGRFRTLRDAEIPAAFRDCFDEIPEHRFRSDLSSTEIRNA